MLEYRKKSYIDGAWPGAENDKIGEILDKFEFNFN